MRTRHKIFINYRQLDAGYAASYLDDKLTEAFGRGSVFKASRSIEAGTAFPPALLAGLEETCAMLVLVGPRWLDPAPGEDGPALHREDDWVRREIAYALRVRPGIPVVPVLVDGQRSVPDAGLLPPELRPLAERQTRHLRARQTSLDLPGIVQALHRAAPGLVARHLVAPVAEPPGDRLPSTLLLPEHHVVDFAGREEEMQRLTAWRDSARSLDVEVVTGAAGQGKSRLALELCRRSQDAGWVAGASRPGRTRTAWCASASTARGSCSWWTGPRSPSATSPGCCPRWPCAAPPRPRSGWSSWRAPSAPGSPSWSNGATTRRPRC
ncbi:hypothetical protein BJF78_12190 [Pseudonocardia sp. CNS-139]|nr:hypothetical protein BJF78_12190 [Pseudonocardia sp. CNS-139]